MANDNDTCWICASARVAPWKKGIERDLLPEDLRITDAAYGTTLPLMKCRDCGFIFATGDSLHRLFDLYSAMDDDEYVETQVSRIYQMRWVLVWMRKHAPAGKTLLDVGAGAGLFVREARSLGLDSVGVEPSHFLVRRGREINGVDLIQGRYPNSELNGRRFDFVTLIDVIEHVGDPVSLLRDCRTGLAAGGRLVVATPNVGSLAARLLGKRWWHFRMAHVGFFNHRTFRLAVDKAGLRVVARACPTWFFPALYVVERLGQYLPVGWLLKLADRGGVAAKLLNRIIRVNPFDSFIYLLEAK